MVLIAHHQTPEVLQPGKQTFDFPPMAITPQLPSVLGASFPPLFPMRRNQFNAALLRQPLIKPVAVVCLVANQLVRRVRRKPAVDSRFDQCYFMGRSTFNVSGDRKTSSVCDGHDLGAFAALCLADSKTPFFAGTKVPSMKASRISIPPRSYRSSASSWTMRWKTPLRTHCWNHRWHVWYGGYRWGKSFHGAPVRKIHKTPSSTSRGSRARRPRGSLRVVAERMMGAIRCHCSFVSSILILLHNQDLMSRFILR